MAPDGIKMAKKINEGQEESNEIESRIEKTENNIEEMKQFTHLTADVFENLQEQINEMREMVEKLLLQNTSTPKKRESFDYL